MTGHPLLRRLGIAHAPVMARVLARAFAEDPNFVALQPDPARRALALERTFVAQAKTTMPFGHVHGELDDAGALAGAAVWHPPGSAPLPVRLQLAGLPAALSALAVTPHAVPRTLAMVAKMERLRPQEPHWYLATIGVDPPHHGRGVGTRLIRAGLDAVDRDALPAYLETSTARNAAWYERLGFRTVGRERFLPDGPLCWLMRRDFARPASQAPPLGDVT